MILSDVSMVESFPPRKSKVLVLYTGGCLGMFPNKFGALDVRKGYLTEQLMNISELKASYMPDFDVKEYETLKDSSDVGIEDWCCLANDIVNFYDQYDGFLIAHGTDTIAYTASALSFILEGLDKPVIITGAALPFSNPYNDARRNLIISMRFAAKIGKINEVCIFFNDVLLRGCRTVKVSEEVVSGLFSPNYPCLAEMGDTDFVLHTENLLPKCTKPFIPRNCYVNLRPVNILSLLIAPGFDCDEFERCIAALVTSHQQKLAKQQQDNSVIASPNERDNELIDAVIVEITGSLSNSISQEYEMVARAVKLCTEADILIIVKSYALHGSLRKKSEEALRQMSPDVVLVGDMTSEAVFCKVTYLFGKGLSTSHVRKLMPVDSRGEISVNEAN